eukprot:scaffold244056_cov29-Prasinocladus_malaysianus.AAC.1
MHDITQRGWALRPIGRNASMSSRDRIHFSSQFGIAYIHLHAHTNGIRAVLYYAIDCLLSVNSCAMASFHASCTEKANR